MVISGTEVKPLTCSCSSCKLLLAILTNRELAPPHTTCPSCRWGGFKAAKASWHFNRFSCVRIVSGSVFQENAHMQTHTHTLTHATVMQPLVCVCGGGLQWSCTFTCVAARCKSPTWQIYISSLTKTGGEVKTADGNIRGSQAAVVRPEDTVRDQSCNAFFFLSTKAHLKRRLERCTDCRQWDELELWWFMRYD